MLLQANNLDTEDSLAFPMHRLPLRNSHLSELNSAMTLLQLLLHLSEVSSKSFQLPLFGTPDGNTFEYFDPIRDYLGLFVLSIAFPVLLEL